METNSSINNVRTIQNTYMRSLFPKEKSAVCHQLRYLHYYLLFFKFAWYNPALTQENRQFVQCCCNILFVVPLWYK